MQTGGKFYSTYSVESSFAVSFHGSLPVTCRGQHNLKNIDILKVDIQIRLFKFKTKNYPSQIIPKKDTQKYCGFFYHFPSSPLVNLKHTVLEHHSVD